MTPFRNTTILVLALLVSSALLSANGANGAHDAPTPSVAPTSPSDFVVPAGSGVKPADAAGFLQRWLILDPIAANGVTQNAVQALVKKKYFPNQLTLIPHDG